mmetsp:Transcript_20305/g.41826  ORF Transcript_20305/g.41826 Transcript_20305/m.41826 type:complete len:256 (-) Transcript_20305:85-852(-)
MRNVPIPRKGNRIQRIADNQRNQRGSQHDWQKEKLDAVEKTKDRKEGIAVNIKGIEPLDRLPDVTVGFCVCQVSIGDFPSRRGHKESQSQPIEKNRIEQKGNPLTDGRPETDGIGNARNNQKNNFQSGKGGVVSGPVVLGLFSIVGRLVDNVRSRRQERLHLVESTLYVHLFNVYQSRQVLGVTRTGGRRHGAGSGHGLSGGRRQRISARWEHQTTAMTSVGHIDFRNLGMNCCVCYSIVSKSFSHKYIRHHCSC